MSGYTSPFTSDRLATTDAHDDRPHDLDSQETGTERSRRRITTPVIRRSECETIRRSDREPVHQVHHVVRLVDDLLDISKITRGAISLERTRVDLSAVVSAAIEMCSSLIEQRGHRVHVHAPMGLYVDGDEQRLVQVLSNLLTNAARYTPSGGEITVSLSSNGGEVILEVRDTGVGLSPELLPKVFDSFVQGARSSDRAEGGLGLGLAITRNLVTLHGGAIEARSAGVGKGSTFSVRLPRTMREAPAAAPVDDVEAPNAQLRRVLLVDDNEDAADLLAELLQMQGHAVTVVHDPESALAAGRTFRPEVAVLDIGLPGMDGYELAARLRIELPDCRMIALTGFGQDSDRARAADAGFVAHLVKPVNVKRLLELLASTTVVERFESAGMQTADALAGEVLVEMPLDDGDVGSAPAPTRP